MKFTREVHGGTFIRSVSGEGFLVAEQHVAGTLMLTGDGIVDHELDKAFEHLDMGDFDALLASAPEVVIVGTGSEAVLTPRELMFAFARNGTGLEVMESRAAARTFNVLVGEGRRVAALLYPV